MRNPVQGLFGIVLFLLNILALFFPQVSLVFDSQNELKITQDSPGVSPEFLVFDDPDHQTKPASVYNSRHQEYFLVWEDALSGETKLSGARMSHQGEILASFTLTTEIGIHHNPDLDYDPHLDSYLVVWEQDPDGGFVNTDIYGRFIPWDGPDPNLVEFPIIKGFRNQLSPKVAYNQDGDWPEYLVVWEDWSDPEVIKINGKRIRTDGTSSPSGTFPITLNPLFDCKSPDVAYQSVRNEYFVVYESGGDIFGIRLGPNGGGIGSDIAVVVSPEDKIIPQIAVCSWVDLYYVVWQGAESDIWGRFITGEGNPDRMLPNSHGLGLDLSAAIACDSDTQHFLLVWSGQDETTNFGIFGRFIYPDMTQGAIFQIREPNAGGSRHYPAVAYGPQGFFVAWSHQNGENYGIRGRYAYPFTLYAPIFHFNGGWLSRN